ncbi:hypothetical protein ABOM_004639 [Aspergillus bombycis]|uniref:Secreted protein n=1 Tax=Aspergillus bombycis TaxID=109264 RepID=A0A1F8A4P1_9EURO|nr:hypothetical protein ABOM_004639 [Aspergillus bombycis]OGM46663.1 hypothetical protein ABOM_004639 [Aspergillus bombycis]
MRLSSLALLVTTTPIALGCTFGFDFSHTYGTWGGANSVRCIAFIFESDNPDMHNQEKDAAVETGCSGGCHNLEYKGKTYEFCYESAASNRMNGDATIQRVDGGVKVNIWPDGVEKKSVFSGGVTSIARSTYHRSNIKCPSA